MRTRPARDAIKFTLNMESLLKNTDSSNNMFDHMNTKNLTQAELDLQKRKKRKITDQTKPDETENVGAAKEPEFKQPVNIKECPFNPFGDDSCDMCGA